MEERKEKFIGDKKKSLIIIGAGGHGKVICDIAVKCGYHVKGFLDDDISKETFLHYPILGETKKAIKYREEAVFVAGIGYNEIREQVVEKLAGDSLEWVTLIHPTAVIGIGVDIGIGTVVMARAVINPGAKIGNHCIVNTTAVVEHDNVLEDYSHVAPGAILTGVVTIGHGVLIGAGAVVRNRITISAGCLIGAGAVVVNDLSEPGVYVGVPAHKLLYPSDQGEQSVHF